MRNYLPAIKVKRSQLRQHWPQITIGLVATVVVVLVTVKVARSAFDPSLCSIDFMHDVQNTKYPNGWNYQGYHYQPVAFQISSNDVDAPNTSLMTTENCTNANYWADANGNGSMDQSERGLIQIDPNVADEHTGPNTQSIRWNNEMPVGVELGVPNQTADNHGVYLNPAFTEKSLPQVRYPVLQRNFGSAGAFEDDAGRATIKPMDSNGNSIYGDPTPIWCEAIETKPPEVTPPGQPNCGPDISGYANPDDRAGAGYMMTGDNCHLSNPNSGFANPTHDQDGWPPSPQTLQCNDPAVFSWYMPYRNNIRHLYEGGANDTDLTQFIGCDNNSFAADGTCNDHLNSFYFNESARQTFNGGFAAYTVLTFRYKIVPGVTLTKSPDGNTYQPGQSFAYTIGALRGASDPQIKDLSIVDTIPSAVTPSPNPGPGCPNGLQPTKVVGQTVTWNFGAMNQLGNLNRPSQVNLCVIVTVNAGAPAGAFTNTVPGPGSIGHSLTNKLVNISTASVTDFVAIPQSPFLTTNGGDVNAGGGIGFSINCNSGGTQNINGEVAGNSKGDYIVSAGGNVGGGGNIANFGSAGSQANSTLSAEHYSGICRPDMDKLAASYNGAAVVHIDANNGAVRADLNAGVGAYPNGLIIVAPFDVTIANNINVQNRITLYVPGHNLHIGAPIAQSGATTLISQLGSFGAIVDGNIDIKASVGSMAGYYFSYGQITTCSDGAGNAIVPQLVPTTCTTPLVVSGLLSAQSFKFNRVGPVGATGSPGPTETINYLGLLFVAPPPVFDGAITPSSGVASESSAPPLY